MDFQGPWWPGHWQRRELSLYRAWDFLKSCRLWASLGAVSLPLLLEILCIMWLDFNVRMYFEASWSSVQDLLFHSLGWIDVIQYFALHGLIFIIHSNFSEYCIFCDNTSRWEGGWRFTMIYTLSFKSWCWFKRFCLSLVSAAISRNIAPFVVILSSGGEG